MQSSTSVVMLVVSSFLLGTLFGNWQGDNSPSATAPPSRPPRWPGGGSITCEVVKEVQ